MKRALAVFCVVFLLVGMLCSVSLADDVNLIANGGFEELTDSGLPAEWYATAYRNQTGYSRMAATEEAAHTGRYSAVVENASSNDARFTCTVKVEPESLYRLSGYVLVDSMEDTGNGANFGIEGIYSFSDCLFETDGEWQYLEWYGETGENQHEVTIGVRVGGYSAESTGKAYFDDLVLERVDSLPQNVVASLWYNANTGFSASEETEETNEKSTVLFVALSAVFLLLIWISVSLFENKGQISNSSAVFALFLLIALVLRVVLAVQIEGYEVDINCFTAWSLRMAQLGPAGFYAPDYFCDYPPGAMLLLWPVGLLMNAVGLHQSSAVLLLVKLLPILCDLIGSFCLYRYTSRRWTNSAAIAASLVYLFNPAVLVNGAAWGQMDSILALFLLWTTLHALCKRWNAAIPLFVVASLIKPQALLFAPLGAAAFLLDLISVKEKKQRSKIIRQAFIGLGTALLCAVAIIAPFSVKQEAPVGWLFELYAKTLGSYEYATLNTANIHYLAGANWMPLTQTPSVVLVIISTLAFFTAAGALLWKKTQVYFTGNTRKARLAAWLLSGTAICFAVLWFLKADYSWYGYVMMAFAYAIALICMFFDANPDTLPYWMSLSLIGIYVLGIKVHERYLFPALILLLMCYVSTHDKRLLGIFAGFSVTTFLNTAIVLDNSILFGAAQGHLNIDTLLLNRLLCIGNIALYGCACFVGINGLRASKSFCKPATEGYTTNRAPASYRQMLLNPKDARLHLSLRDYLIMGITMIAYGVLAFSNLGSMIAPQTAWVSTSKDESIVLELENSTTFKVLYYAGVSYNDFAIAVSEDGENWSEAYPCEMREGLCYRWNYALNASEANGKVIYPSSNPGNVLWLKGKYLRVDACEAGLNLWELVIRDEMGNMVPVKLAAHNNAKSELLYEAKPAAHLIDEQDSCRGEPGWFTGTYFDEIYHARTAYEHLHGQAPYETTHPPLGKLLMSVGIALFGMTPFGWRFAGTLIGVLMLPAIYLLAMQLTHKRSVASVAMLALTFDLMHFTQTRIATIDSFPVFFILLTYLFMIRYMQMDFFAVSDTGHARLMDKAYLRTLVPLLCCGICMGLSIGCKWIGIYSAVGLAILFFLTAYRQIRVWKTAWEMEEETPRVKAAREFTIHRVAMTCGFCVIFFVVIPCLIYAASYIPYLAPTGPVTIERIIQAQKGMLSYHSTPGLGMDHPFQSPWWQWPFILKPMWFAQDTFEPSGYASTILCFGNPWVFYIGAAAMMLVLACWIGSFVRLKDRKLIFRHGNGDLTYAILAVAFLAQYLPWVLVPRSMYMYHYFASVPFIIIATAVMMEKQLSRNRLVYRLGIAVYIAGTVAFFVMFFPYASGYLTSTRWLDAMKWFSKLYY